jgi:drug/metabolite transporter (DMT)-like permease
VAAALPARTFMARHALPILIVGMVFAAFSPVFVRLSEVGPIATAAGRLALPLPFFFALMWLRPQDRIAPSQSAGRHDFRLVLLSGAFFAGDMVLWNTSIMLTTITNASVLANITPVFVVAGSWLLFKDKPGRLFLVGMAVALAGSAIMMRESIGGADASRGALTGDVLAMTAAGFYAGYVLTLSRVRKRVSIVATMAWGGLMATVILVLLAVITEDQLLPRTTEGWLALLGIALLVQVGGQMLIAMSLAHVPPGFAAMLFLAQPVIPGVVAWILFDEAVTVYQLIGAAALLAGLEISRRGTPPKEA